jgi:hypothetical protein
MPTRINHKNLSQSSVWRGIKNRLFKIRPYPKCELYNVYTPASAATLTFVERTEIEDQIKRALMMPGMQLIVYGHSGSGKTTVTTNVLKNSNIKYIVTNCSRGDIMIDLVRDAFDRLNVFYTATRSGKSASGITSELNAALPGVDSSLQISIRNEMEESSERVLALQPTFQRLADFLGKEQVVWIIEDFHKVDVEERQKLSSILKIFADKSNTYSAVKIIAIGAVGTAREIINHSEDLVNRVAEIHVPLMTKEEIERIITIGQILMNVEFSKQIIADIIMFSNSLPAVCHHLCYNMCYKNGILATQKSKKVLTENFSRDAIKPYLQQKSDSFKETFDRALKPRDGKYDTRRILEAFCHNEKDELTPREILNYRNNNTRYRTSINAYLKLLTTVDYGEVLRFNENSGRYSFATPFHKAYAIMRFFDEDKTFRLKNIDKFSLEHFVNILRTLQGM